MSAADPLEALQRVEKEARQYLEEWGNPETGEAEDFYGQHIRWSHPIVIAAIAAWEKERIAFERAPYLRAEVLKIADEAQAEGSHCRQPFQSRFYGISQRLRKAAE